MDKQEKRNLIISVILMTAIFGLWNYFFPTPLPVATKSVETLKAPTAPVQKTVPVSAKRLTIETDKIRGSINLTGGMMDDLILKNFHETPDETSDPIRLLAPIHTQEGYYAEMGWLSSSNMPLPNHTTSWQTQDTQLSVYKPVTLTYDNGKGLVFERLIHVDDNYMFTLTDTVYNKGPTPQQLYPYGLVKRLNTPPIQDFFILHEGPLGYLNRSLVELKYDAMHKNPVQSYKSVGGWLGITDKYWLTALIPDQNEKIKATYRYESVGSENHYQVDWMGSIKTIEPGGRYTFKSHFFAGAKTLNLLDGYEKKIGMEHFDLAVDFGWFYIMTKPIFHALMILKDWLGNFGLAILAFTVILKAAFFPLANKSYRSMGRLRTLQPKIKALQERYGDDKIRMNQELMTLYKREKVNPVGGCLPMILQIPVFFALYKVLFVTLEMRHAPFYGWIHDLSAPDPTSLFNLFGLLPWSPPSFLMVGAWPVIMGFTMFLQQKLNPTPTDPAQAKAFLFLPLILTFFLSGVPAGLVIYWSWSNILTCLQQWFITRMAVKK